MSTLRLFVTFNYIKLIVRVMLLSYYSLFSGVAENVR